MSTPRLRPAIAQDAAFIYSVYEATARDLVESMGKRWAEELMREKSSAEASDGITKIIMLGEQDVGFYCAVMRPSELWLESLFLLPQFHGKGLGKTLLAQALAQARSVPCPLRCHVMAYNPAIAFYQSQGLVVVKEESNFVILESAA